MARESKIEPFGGNDVLSQCLISQWFDYAILFVTPAINSKSASEAILHELNDYLITRSYLIGQSLTLADVVMFYALHALLVSIYFAQFPFKRSSRFHLMFCLQESQPSVKKEHLQNVSRWFNHLQSNKLILQNLSKINLTSSSLHSWATGTHI